ncbi:lipopolysaccharide transport system ATP-binding protein [Yersinia frederiksenii]|uniref:Lipopolysaccharide transport system ATP-binding protein n=2 Tax=Yersinia frederiksenii TaxID=29484 RepID=A0A380Q0Q8_YERFR|nr:ABC transporter ATP-binding protein [Yersinia frederiksenii]ATM96526.1 ABC transporter ATP-binding protein [Yersinia frederiksenii]EEQ13693.1 ATP binding component of ABC-transporter [Yersinia frederiksenii ATCC 33641]KGA48087.1 ABC transporter family protein [Yersinia frederiksenii ATCC 33641]SUP79149.1 lipopolysaccharide transport system ATP-binding protein [Yersinia frederiksenii]
MGSITVTNIGKAYKNYPTRFGRLIEWISPVKIIRHTLTWVLRDISFTVRPGEAIGLIGINGAGKSTLLKLITGTAHPTTGSIKLTGRVAALLELGIGFHPDFSGRQNVYMSGQLLGLTVAEIERLMPEIEAFAEIGEYIDQPVRVYSSGMQMRLAFSVATAIRPDILIVDEALSVGDAYFQHKSFERIREYRKQGTTLLLVSHDKAAIQSICDRAILLNAGTILMEGKPEAVMDYYNAMLAAKDTSSVKQTESPDGLIQTVSGSGDASIIDIGLYNNEGVRTEVFNVGELANLCIKVGIASDIPEIVLGYMIKDRLGQVMYGTNTYHLDKEIKSLTSGQIISFNFLFPMNLGEGSYSIAVALHEQDTHIHKNYEWRDLALIFDIINIDKTSFVGVSWLEPEVNYIYER